MGEKRHCEASASRVARTRNLVETHGCVSNGSISRGRRRGVKAPHGLDADVEQLVYLNVLVGGEVCVNRKICLCEYDATLTLGICVVCGIGDAVRTERRQEGGAARL